MKSSILALWLISLVATETSAFVSQQQKTDIATQLFARKPFITGNWKLNPQTKSDAIDLATSIANAINPDSHEDVGLFVPFPFIETVQKIAGNKFIVGAEVRIISFEK